MHLPRLIQTLPTFLGTKLENKPFMLSHILTTKCNCRCKTCDIWKKKPEKELEKEQIFKILDKAVDVGIKVYAVWGGEPLLMKDLPEISRYAKKKKLVTLLFTNGALLEERANEICPYTDFLLVSIDSPDETNDEIRGRKGLFKIVVNGIKKAKEHTGCTVIINTVVSKLNQDKIPEMLELAEKLGVKASFEPMQEVGGYNQKYKLSMEKEAEIFKYLIQEKKRGNNRLSNSIRFYSNFVDGKNYACHMPKVYLTIGPGGEIVTCDLLEKSKSLGLGYNEGYFGNILDLDLKEFLRSEKYQQFIRQAEKCQLCEYSCVIDYSNLYGLDPEAVMTAIRLLIGV